MNKKLKAKILSFPDSPGVYLMLNSSREIIYVGKATSLKERVRSYFNYSELADKTRLQMNEVADIGFVAAESPLEAMLLETNLIKKYTPKYNIRDKDDKSRIYVNFTKEKFPRIYLLRETDLPAIRDKKPILYGPFSSVKALSDALELIRKIIPFRSCRVLPKNRCLYGHLGMCEMPCEGKISEKEYRIRIRQIRDFFEGKKARVLSALKRELKEAVKKLEYEKAAKIRDRIFALEHLKQMFILRAEAKAPLFERIEGYDISNISGAYATGSMVAFIDGVSEKSEYRKFKIKSASWRSKGANDTAMLREVLVRRFHNDWPKPDLILVDGGRGQVNTAILVLEKMDLKIPVVGLAKGKDRKKDELITSKTLPRRDIALFKEVRDEAHRFARGYYQKLHRKRIRF